MWGYKIRAQYNNPYVDGRREIERPLESRAKIRKPRAF